MAALPIQNNVNNMAAPMGQNYHAPFLVHGPPPPPVAPYLRSMSAPLGEDISQQIKDKIISGLFVHFSLLGSKDMVGEVQGEFLGG